MIVEDVLALGAGELSLTKYADLIESSVLTPAGAENITLETGRTEQGLSAVRFEMSFFTHRVIRFIYLFDSEYSCQHYLLIPPRPIRLRIQPSDWQTCTLDSLNVN